MPEEKLNWLFTDTPGMSNREILSWWEKRRITYNMLLLLVGIITWLLVLFVGPLTVKPGEDFEEPIMMIIGPALYAIMANICYTLGPLFDVMFLRDGRSRCMDSFGVAHHYLHR